MDIVERLRDPNWIKYCPEAADEIERLREALKDILSLEGEYDIYHAIEIARSALQQKESE